jgi:dienelactone hydrolase
VAVAQHAASHAESRVPEPADPQYSPHDLDPRRERLYRQWDGYLRQEARRTYQRRGKRWHWDFTSLDAYERSVAGMRRRWKSLIGGWPRRRTPLRPRFELLATERDTGGRYRLERVWLTALPGVEIDALLLSPPHVPGERIPAVLVQHGLSGTPEAAVGLVADGHANPYRRIGLRLVERGYVVLAPHMVGGFGHPGTNQLYTAHLAGIAQGRARTQLNRLAIEYGRTLMGLELFALSRALDFLASLQHVDPGRMGMYGLSQGGQSALWLSALDTRLAATVISGFFNERFGKQLVTSERYVSYLETEEEDRFLMARLVSFGDAELASLICPRPLLVEHGKQDRIGWWEDVRDEFVRARSFYERLRIPERARLAIHEGGHVADGTEALPFLDSWLKEKSP